jgi:hypothetical protein
LLYGARSRRERLTRLPDFPHEFIEWSDGQQAVDAVVGFRFGRREAASFRTRSGSPLRNVIRDAR